MYLSNTNEELRVVCDTSAVTTEPTYSFSYNDIDSTGMILPQSTTAGSMTGAIDVVLVGSPASSTNRQIIQGTIYNGDTEAKSITVSKYVSTTQYIVVKIILSPGMTLHYSRENNWSISGEQVNKKQTYRITTYNTPGSYTYTKPSGLKYAMIVLGGAGGGGGSGRRGASLTNRYGGGGGGSAAIVTYFTIPGTTTSVTVGAGGTGGAGVGSDDTNGNTGASGGDTAFGTALAKGGSGGIGGTSTNGTGGNGGAPISCSPAYGPFSHGGGGGINGQTNTAIAASSGMTSGTFLPGGGGASGLNNSNIGSTTSNFGSRLYNWGYLNTAVATGFDGNNNVNMTLTLNPVITGDVGFGTSGAGGNQSILNGSKGGYCSGGGGGAGTANGTTSGKGGDGGNGLCVIFEIY